MSSVVLPTGEVAKVTLAQTFDEDWYRFPEWYYQDEVARHLKEAIFLCL
jgi:hypothetical protein